MQVTERLLPLGNDTNRPGVPLDPQLIIIHSTANPNVDAEAHYQYWAGGYRASSAHYVVDDQVALRLIPEEERAWHAGQHANRAAIGIELCEFDDAGRAGAAYANLVALVAEILQRRGWGLDRILCHAHVSRLDPEDTDHTDPLAYFAAKGWEWDDFLQDAERAGQPPAPPPAAPQPVAVVDAAGRHLVDGQVVDGHTTVPLRPLVEALGLAVEWDGRAVLRWPGPKQ